MGLISRVSSRTYRFMAKKLVETGNKGRSTNSLAGHSSRKSSHYQPVSTAASHHSSSSVPPKNSGKKSHSSVQKNSSSSSNSSAVLNGTVKDTLADMPKPSQEAINVNQLLNKNDVNSVPENLVKQLIEFTGCSEQKAH